MEYHYRHTKYAYLLLHFFAKVLALLSKEEAARLLNNRFFNSEGRRGGNKPLDLEMEHLNFLLKMALQSVLGNLTKNSAQRVARSLGTLETIMNGIRKDLALNKKSGHHGTKDPEQAVNIILKDLIDGNVFLHTPGRCGYPSFKAFKQNVVQLDFRDFFKWAHDHFTTWKGIYENPQRNN